MKKCEKSLEKVLTLWEKCDIMGEVETSRLLRPL